MSQRLMSGDMSAWQERQARVEDCTLTLTTLSSAYDPLVDQNYVIPVYFHVIYPTSGPGYVSPERVTAQMAVLNADFARQFNTSIQFELMDITYTQNDAWFTTEDDLAFKSELAVDPSRYLNVYSQQAGGSLGYAFLPPGTAGETEDGVVVNHLTVGGRNNGYSVYDQGRSLVHEVGHYLGLYHTFEGIGAACANAYDAGDLVVDTPPQSVADYGTVPGSSCGVNSAINNFMNYSDDIAMNTFTSEQSNRMVCSVLSYRPALFNISDGVEEAASGLPVWLLFEASKH